jgi:RNA polymerase sigma-70 factor (ECF subfamily)
VTGFPDTRLSLIARLGHIDDDEAWREFRAIYGPAVYRLARRRGLQHADAEDLLQQVFAAVGRAIHRWDPDPARGRFRSWLAKIAQNAAINALTRRPRDAAKGGTTVFELLDRQLGKQDSGRELIELELRRSLFRWAAERVRGEFGEKTWRAFWLTMVEGQEIQVAASALQMSVGSVYAARSRIVRRLKREIESHVNSFQGTEIDDVRASTS